MGFKRYRGPVGTVEQAMFANLTVTIRCLLCNHQRRIYAYRLVNQHRKTAVVKLDEIVNVFRCDHCRSTETVVSAPVHWV